MAAQQDADAIIARLGLDGDGPGNVNEIVSRIESEPDQTTNSADGTSTGDMAGSNPAQADSSAATGTEGGQGGAASGTDGSKAAAAGDQQPAGVLLKDGKHFLPYEKHAEERRARLDAEARAKQLEVQLAELKAGKGAGAQSDNGTDNAQASTGTLEGDLAMVDELEAKAKAYEDEGLSELASTTRASATAMKAMAKQIQELGGYVKQLKERDSQEQARTAQTVQEQISEAIDNNPTLRYLDETYDANPQSKALWDRIEAEDKFLKTLPAWQGKSYADRFAAAIKRVELESGAIQVPVEYQTVAQVKAAAEGAAREAGEFRPNTLSDLPGGGTPRGGNDNPYAEMDPVQMERIMMESPDKAADILARAM